MNEVIRLQLNHRSIRKFKQKAISPEIISTLVDVAQQTATSNYAQSYSMISVTDLDKKRKIAEIGKQAYIAEADHLFIMLSDQARNAAIVSELEGDTEVFSSFDKFFVGATDAILAAQNVVIAAESLGIGAVLLGSILNQVDELVDLLDLPELVVPVLGIALGYPDQEPQLKPRMPKELIHFENEYPEWKNVSDQLTTYNETVTEYYSARETNQRIDTFEKMIANWSSYTHPGRLKMLDYIKNQGMSKY